MILMIDNYDSFTYNLVQYLGELGQSLKVFRNDKITLDKIKALGPKSIVISVKENLRLRLMIIYSVLMDIS